MVAGNLSKVISAAALALAGTAALVARSHAASPLPDLSDYRTVTTAITTQVIRSAETPTSHRAYLGVDAALDDRGRLLLAAVDPDSPAGRAGLQAGDVLLRVAGRATQTAADLRALLHDKSPGETLALRVERQRKARDVSVTLGATSRPMKFGPVRATLGVRLEEPQQSEGAAVQTVTSGSPAAQAGIKPGDVLLKLDGDLIAGPGYVREVFDTKQPGDAVKLTVLREGEELEVETRLAASTNQALGRNAPRGLWQRDTFRLAVVLVEYPDVKHRSQITTNDWWELFFSAGTYTNKANATGQPVHGSVNDYYREVSAGAFRLEGRVFDWVELSRKRADYAQGTNLFDKSLFLGEALDALRERVGADALAPFDGLLFIHAGERVRTANRGSLYWPHQGSFDHRGKRWRYVIGSEGGRRMASISTFCHEFGHMLGLPDLYAQPENPGSEGLGAWCAMSNENSGGRPQHFSAWCKERLGWLKPAVIDPTVKQKLILAPVENSTNECFKVLVRPDGSEYLLLENRRRQGFDASLPGEGLLIWRVTGGRPILEESHGVEGPAGPRVFPGSVPYPSRANNAFTPWTTPSSHALLGGGLPVYITNIRKLADGRVTFQIGYEYE
jgi:M6 family metalloprotease-like protein